MELGEPTEPEVSPEPTQCNRFKRLQQRLQEFVASSNSIDSTYDVDGLQAQSTAARLELTNYLTDLRVLRSSDIAKLVATNSDSHNAENLKFWIDRQNMYLKLRVLAQSSAFHNITWFSYSITLHVH